MSKIENGGLDQYGVEPFEQQQIGAAGVEGVKITIQCRPTSPIMVPIDSTDTASS